ncbi:MAG: hypothetical protein B6D41_11965 [Chloroflexi bacterium UTCFX4]|nr:MAG: hypothetical protein B6D41_11965 [Chloroflexi bacterium UTCFX4]
MAKNQKIFALTRRALAHTISRRDNAALAQLVRIQQNPELPGIYDIELGNIAALRAYHSVKSTSSSIRSVVKSRRTRIA